MSNRESSEQLSSHKINIFFAFQLLLVHIYKWNIHSMSNTEEAICIYAARSALRRSFLRKKIFPNHSHEAIGWKNVRLTFTSPEGKLSMELSSESFHKAPLLSSCSETSSTINPSQAKLASRLHDKTNKTSFGHLFKSTSSPCPRLLRFKTTIR